MGEKMKIVYAYVCGDILHKGHLLQLENAKAMGDKLIVGVLTDEAVMEKKKAPTISFAQRMRLIQAIGCVDAVVPQDNYSPINNIKMLKPDIHMESESHIGYAYLDEIEKMGIRVVMTPYLKGVSSTQIKKDIKEK